ncbi:hypothetical protein BHE74_00046068 [Ensete ventricosum]|nr:hypothetical protein BHE74_00046068 [Ensete ventricosum]
MNSSRAHEHVERVEKGQNVQGLEKRQELISLVRIRFHIWRRRNDQDSRVKRDSGLRQGSKMWRHDGELERGRGLAGVVGVPYPPDPTLWNASGQAKSGGHPTL